MSWRAHESQRREDRNTRWDRTDTGVRCGAPSPPACPAGHAGPHHLGVARPGDHGARRPERIPTERARACTHTHTHRGNREHLTGLSVLLCGCAESPRRVSGLPLSVSLAPSGGLTPRVCSGPSQGGVPELGGQPAARGPLGLPARRWGRRPGLPGGQDSGPVRPLLAESPSPVQKLPQGHALVL